MDKLVNVSQAAEMLGVSTKIMRIWDNDGKVEAVRTAGGHRRYRVSEIEKLQGIHHEEVKKPDKEVVANYARVSSHEQKAKGDLDRQSTRLSKYSAEKGYHVAHVLTDVGSGMSSKRAKLKTLFNLVENHEITKVYEMVEQQSEGPYLELFARRNRENWFVWGNEVQSDLPIEVGTNKVSEETCCK